MARGPRPGASRNRPHACVVLDEMKRATLIAFALAIGCTVPQETRLTGAGCPLSPLTSIASSQGGWEFQFRRSGELAGPAVVKSRDGTKGQLWVLRTDDPPLYLSLRAERMDSPGLKVFEILRSGTETPDVPFPGGGRGYVYIVSTLTPVLTEPGCWRVGRIGVRAQDRIVLEVK